MSFSNLKKNNKSIFAKLSQELEKSQNTQSGGADERIWKPEMDVSGNGYAVIRFLPAPDGEDIPWAKLWSHAFQGPGGWYIENSLTTMNQKDPVSEYNRELWNSGSDKDKETIIHEMSRCVDLSVPLIVDAELGQTWGEAEE